jgi:hypothetical protein
MNKKQYIVLLIKSILNAFNSKTKQLTFNNLNIKLLEYHPVKIKD